MNLGLYYMCAFGGLVMIVGGIWLIYKQKIYLNPSGDKVDVVAVEIPFFGKLRTNVPALALFILGFVPLIYPIYKANTEYTRVEQEITSEKYPVSVYVVVRQKSLNTHGKFVISIPNVNSADYEPQIIYLANGFLTDQQEISLSEGKHGVIELREKSLQFANPSLTIPVTTDIRPPDARFK